jgi:hypothetical protein
MTTRILQKQPHNPFDIALAKVIAERVRQKQKGYTTSHDDRVNDSGDLASAASAYALAAADKLNPQSQGDGQFDRTPPVMWPDGWKPWNPGSPIEALAKTAACAIAEMERLLREEQRSADATGRA